MLENMKFVRGAVSTKTLMPEMKHFRIEGGRIKAYNGTIALQSPIDFNVDCTPLASALVTAIGKCNEVMSIGMTDAGRLRIESGPFKAFIDCIDGPVPDVEPAGEMIPLDGLELMSAIQKVLPFVGSDASRPWVNGILLRDYSAFATNNVCLVEYWIGVKLPITANIPIEAIREIIRIGSPPTHAQVCEHSITFHYPEDRWLLTQLYSTDWPDVQKILERPGDLKPIPPALFEGLDAIRPFLDKSGNVYIRNGGVHTSPTDNLGASYQVEGIAFEGIYKLDMLKLLEAASHADMEHYPNPCPFYNDRFRGVIIGLRP